MSAFQDYSQNVLFIFKECNTVHGFSKYIEYNVQLMWAKYLFFMFNLRKTCRSGQSVRKVFKARQMAKCFHQKQDWRHKVIPVWAMLENIKILFPK